MLKKISPIIICVCIAFTICVSAMGFADGVSVEPPTETTVNIISVEKYLIALYEAVNNIELADKTDTTEVLAWAETNGILESIADDTQNISEIPLTQETALVMLSRTYTQLAEITDMITEVSHTANNRQPQPGMPGQSKENIPDMGNAENTQQPAVPDNSVFSGGNRQPQMPKAEISDDIQNVTQTTAEISEIAENEQISSADPAAAPVDNNVPDTKNEQVPQKNGASAGGRAASGLQGSQNRHQGENMKMPSGNNSTQNNSQGSTGTRSKTRQDSNMPSGEEKTNNQRNMLFPENTQLETAENSDSQTNISNLIEDMEKESQITENSDEQVSDVSLSEHIKEYYTTYICLLVLAAAFVFVKLFRRRRY